MSNSLTGYLYDDRLRERANAAGRNYWYAYIHELFDEVGLRSDRLDLESAADPDALAAYRVLVLGSFEEEHLPSRSLRTLEDWVRAGGVLIGFATGGLDSLWGIEGQGHVGQQAGPFSVSAHLRLRDHPYTAGVHMVEHADQTIPIFAPCRRVTCQDAAPVADLVAPAGAAITYRALGDGLAMYFAFDLCQCLWVLHQGRPIDRDFDGDGQYRTGDQMVIPQEDSVEVPYADELLNVWANMLAECPQPFVHQLPPNHEGRVPDLLIHFGGDDEGLSDGSQRAASDHFRSLGLPYHINIMPSRGAFALSDEDFAHIRSNGHETSLHPNFINPRGQQQQLTVITEDALREQVRLYRERFGHTPVVTVDHWCCWWGWAEPARWLAAEGVRGDNSRGGFRFPPLNPVNTVAAGFGTVFPHFVYDDHTQANARLDFVYIPIVYYEPGTTTGGPSDEPSPGEARWEALRFWLDTAAEREWTLNCFFHPVHMVRNANTRAALDELLRYTSQQRHRVVFMGTDEVCEWWHGRAESTVQLAGRSETATYQIDARHASGLVLRVPLSGHTVAVTVNGEAAQGETRERFGRQWLYVPLAAGRHTVAVEA